MYTFEKRALYYMGMFLVHCFSLPKQIKSRLKIGSFQSIVSPFISDAYYYF
jgi:hypothetical protein